MAHIISFLISIKKIGAQSAVKIPKETLLDFWNSIQLVDGSWNPIPEIYFTANYIIKGKKDLRPWSEIIKKYFYVKDYKNDFQIEWKTMTPEWNIKRFFDLFYTKCCLPDE